MDEKKNAPFVLSVAIEGDYLIYWMYFQELLEVFCSCLTIGKMS